MRRKAILSLRVRLIAVVLIAVLPALAFILHTASEQRQMAVREIEQDALRVARLAASGQERLIEAAHQLLLVLAHTPEIEGEDAESASAMLRKLLKQYPLYANFGVIRMDGTVFASALPVLENVNLRDRTAKAFGFQRSHEPFSERIVIRITFAAHAGSCAPGPQTLLEGLDSILAATVTVVNEPRRGSLTVFDC
jgi:hypothetical protein